MTLGIHSESLHSACGSVNDHADIPVEVEARLKQARELIGNHETVTSNWRTSSLGKLLLATVIAELFEKNQYLAGDVVAVARSVTEMRVTLAD